jgi:hypothetical protein
MEAYRYPEYYDIAFAVEEAGREVVSQFECNGP